MEDLIARLKIQEHHPNSESKSKDSEHVGKTNLTEAKNIRGRPSPILSKTRNYWRKIRRKPLSPARILLRQKM